MTNISLDKIKRISKASPAKLIGVWWIEQTNDIEIHVGLSDKCPIQNIYNAVESVWEVLPPTKGHAEVEVANDRTIRISFPTFEAAIEDDLLKRLLKYSQDTLHVVYNPAKGFFYYVKVFRVDKSSLSLMLRDLEKYGLSLVAFQKCEGIPSIVFEEKEEEERIKNGERNRREGDDV